VTGLSVAVVTPPEDVRENDPGDRSPVTCSPFSTLNNADALKSTEVKSSLSDVVRPTMISIPDDVPSFAWS
jgi:hypothetical protein